MNAEERAVTTQIAQARSTLALATVNLKFARLPKALKRIAIAQDVLEMLTSPHPPEVDSTYFRVRAATIPTQAGLCSDPSDCCVCGIGALMLAHFRLFDSVPTSHAELPNSFARIEERLGGYFSYEQLQLIEAAFEHNDDWPSKPLDHWVKLAHKYSTRAQVLAAIMRNIIRHGGTFKPGKEPRK